MVGFLTYSSTLESPKSGHPLFFIALVLKIANLSVKTEEASPSSWRPWLLGRGPAVSSRGKRALIAS